MTAPRYTLRHASALGSGHAKKQTNNQDACLTQEFAVSGRTYRVGLVSDGCGGLPAYSHTEVGAHLLVLTALARIQALIGAGHQTAAVPGPLFHQLIEALRMFGHIVTPAGTYLPYPGQLPQRERFRSDWTAFERFMGDYLAATLLGFIDDGTTLTTFTRGDGVVIINDAIEVIDQNNQPDYLSISVDRPDGGFAVNTYPSTDIRRVVIATDGLVPLLATPDGLAMLLDKPNPFGLHGNANLIRRRHADRLTDDWTLAVLERQPEPEKEENADGQADAS